jgi:hypothetical protein
MTLIPDLERDLVTAAGRKRSVRTRTRRAAGLGAAAAAALALGAVALWPTDEGAGPKRAAGEQRPAPPAPPPQYDPPVRGTVVRLSSFDFRGIEYRLSGYRSRDGSVCMRIAQTPPDAPGLDRPTGTCAGGPFLGRALRGHRVLNVGGGGGPPIRLKVAGFAVADVSRLKAVGTDWPWHAELTRAWRPWKGPRIRAFVIIVDPPRGAKLSRRGYTRIRAVEAGR